MKHLIQLLIFSGLFTFMSAQTFQATYGWTCNDFAYGVVQTSDGGYMATGNSCSFGGIPKGYIVKTDYATQEQWSYNFGGGNGQDIISDGNGYSYVSGSVNGVGAGNSDMFLMKISDGGVQQWNRTYGGTGNDYGMAAKRTYDGGFVLAGFTFSYGSGQADGYIVKTDASGNPNWNKAIGTTSYDYFTDVCQTPDSGYVAVGRTAGFGGTNYHIYIVKFNSSGDTLWTKVLVTQSLKEEMAEAVIATSDGNILVAGKTNGFGIGGTDALLVKMDQAGNIIWARSYGGASNDQAFGVVEVTGGYVFAGESMSFSGNLDGYGGLIDANGNAVVLKTFGDGSTNADNIYDIEKTSDEGFILGGKSKSWGFGLEDVYLVKLDSQGVSGCNEANATLTSVSGSFTILQGGSLSSGMISGSSNMILTSVNTRDTIVCLACDTLIPGWSHDSTVVYTAYFSENATGAHEWFWDFGDGNTSTQPDPSHTYSGNGTYNVCLIVTNACKSDTFCDNVTIQCPFPGPAFSVSTNELQASFTDNSTNVNSWLWDFGDGNTSASQNPVHSYSSPGTYQVCLTVTNACGSDSSCSMVTVTCTPPGGAFSWSSNNYVANFTSLDSSATSWFWDFGDGNTSTSTNPSHTYASTGTYTVCLVTSNICGTDSTCHQVTVTCPAPSANFGWTATELSVDFTGNDSLATSWLWDFGDGNTDTTENPTHSYAAAGSYYVCLTMSNTCGSIQVCDTVTVTCTMPVAGFSWSSANDTVFFTSTASGAAGTSWEFGDGNSDTTSSPFHVYSTSGIYYVCQVVMNSCGADSICDSVQVIIDHLPDNKLSAEIYPVPADREIRINIGSQVGPEGFSIELMDMQGRVILNRNQIRTGSYLLDVSELPEAIYILRITSNESSLIKRIVVRRE